MVALLRPATPEAPYGKETHVPRATRIATAAAFMSGALMIAAPVGSASTARLNHSCYLETQAVQFTAGGFAPDAPVVVSLAGRRLGATTANGNGVVGATFRAPKISSKQQTKTLTITDGKNAATGRVVITKAGADFSPSKGNPRTLRVRFSVFGLGPAFVLFHKSPHQTIYLHYIRPNGKLKLTVKIGKTSGPCGGFRTSRRRIIPFHAETGFYRLYFDARRSFSRKTVPQVGVGFRVRRIVL